MMWRTLLVMRRVLIIVATLPLVVGIAACGDDDDDQAAASARTTDAYCADLSANQDEEGPTDAFFEQYPDPTIEDWAEGLPGIIARAQDGRDQFAAITPSADLAGERQTLLNALDAVIATFERSLELATAGDQDAFDAEERRNQDENLPALGSAFEALEDACSVDR
jgi:hypothetical protein